MLEHSGRQANLHKYSSAVQSRLSYCDIFLLNESGIGCETEPVRRNLDVVRGWKPRSDNTRGDQEWDNHDAFDTHSVSDFKAGGTKTTYRGYICELL